MAHQNQQHCDGRGLREALAVATAWLEGRVEELNRLNVYPIPDGDTGTNMYLTMQAVLREVARESSDSAAAVANAAAQGALMGARGNSGVILSQLLRGFAHALGGRETFTAEDLARALEKGALEAYACVIQPAEGTILTVGREAAEAADLAVGQGGCLDQVLAAVVSAARASVERTPLLLPVLREAGVVDAGGLGLMLIMEGAHRLLAGDVPPMAVATTLPRAAVPAEREMPYGYCTELIIRGQDLPLEEIGQQLTALGDSVLVVGDRELVRVHVHTLQPGSVLDYAAGLGSLHGVKVDNMQEQHEHRHFAALGAEAPSDQAVKEAVGVVAVVNGDGFADLFRSMGAASIVLGGRTMNPTAEELLRAVNSVPYRQVILLPNNPNVIMNAQQVASLSSRRVVVVPTRTVPQGVAALLAYDESADLQTNLARMGRATGQVRTGEVTRAVRTGRFDGLPVQEGQVIGLVEGKVVASSDNESHVVDQVLEHIAVDHSGVVTIYYGQEVARAQAQALANRMRQRLPGLEVQVLSGGQPLYDYVISAE